MPKTSNHKQDILTAALKLFAIRGYGSTPISLIASTAKVSQGLMYNFFNSKEALLKSLMNRGFEDIGESMKAYLAEPNPRKAIALHIRKTCEIIKEQGAFWRLLHAIRLQGKVLPVMQKDYQEIVHNVTATFEKIFRKMGYKKPALEALLFLAQIDGLVILYLQDENIPLDQLAQQLINRYKP